MPTEPKKKGGRPRKHLNGIRPTLAFRLRGDVAKRLAKEVEKTGQPIAKIVEGLLEKSFELDREDAELDAAVHGVLLDLGRRPA